ncbi:hypothetical protein PINS_up020214, partial [Pythium insidiosum]
QNKDPAATTRGQGREEEEPRRSRRRAPWRELLGERRRRRGPSRSRTEARASADARRPSTTRTHRTPSCLPNGALRAPASAAKENRRGAGRLRRTGTTGGRALLVGWELSGARAPFAFMEIFSALWPQPSAAAIRELAYRAAKLLQRHRVPIFRVDQALQLFREAGDGAAAVALYEQYLDEFAAFKAGRRHRDGQARARA